MDLRDSDRLNAAANGFRLCDLEDVDSALYGFDDLEHD